MELLRCTQCKGDLQLSDDGLYGRCIFCGASYHFKNEKNARVISLLNQANVSRLKGDYESAILAYQIALKEDETDADAYWGIVLSTYGIDYVEDSNGKLIPTCRRTIKTSILDDLNYKKAIQYSSEEQAKQFQSQAEEIDKLQSRIKEKIKFEQDFDVFICFKSADEQLNPTRDRFIARQIYDELTKRNIRTFYSEKSLKGRLGEDYEPIIYKALYSCKFFILVATNADYIQSPWVRNEWTRFRDRIQEENLENCAFVVFDNVKENEIPPIFRKQGIDLTKYPAGGYEVEIADGLELRLKSEQKQNETDLVLAEDKIVDLMDQKLKGTRETFKERIDRATGYYEIGNHTRAIEVLEETIDMYPRKSIAWWTMTCFLTDNFTKDYVNVHKNYELEKKILFYYENAFRFASIEEKKEYTEKSKEYFEKLQSLDNVDKILLDYNRDLEVKFEIKNNLDNCEVCESQVKMREYNSLEQNLKDNQQRADELKARLNHKTYYIKDLPKEKTWFFSFLRFISVLIWIVSIVVTCVKLGTAIANGDNVVVVIVASVILLIIGSIPAIIARFAERKKRYSKVEPKIDKDQKELELLQSHSQELKSKIDKANQISKDAEYIDKLNEELSIINDKLNKHIENLATFIQDENILNYINDYKTKETENLENNILENVEKINEFESECDILKETNKKKILQQTNNRPKFYNPKHEKQEERAIQYIEENKKYIFLVEQEIDKLEHEIKMLNFKKRNSIFDMIYQNNSVGFENEENENKKNSDE